MVFRQSLGEMVADVYWEYDFHAPTKKYLGDSHGIHHLIGLYWAHDDLCDRPHEVSLNGKYGDEAIAELDVEIVRAANTWMTDWSGKG
ncbi:hypothetical protein [Novipirellula sp.]|uniref:hypothetical protein n=1 Tax=Novipirellula sp. TaxID=2795430 RepID=UPI00356178E0